MNKNASTGLLARPLARFLAPHLLAPHCSLRSFARTSAPLHSFARSLAHVYELIASISYSFDPLCMAVLDLSPLPPHKNERRGDESESESRKCPKEVKAVR